MRIIGGNLKGKKISLPQDKNTRPLRDIVKESIFNLILHSKKIGLDINKSNILDLFSGTGSFGIECISRGAQKVTFIENYKEAIDVLKKNLQKLDCLEKSRIIERDCFDIFDSQKIFDEKFDIIFLDPPYKEMKINFIIEKIIEMKILNNGGIIIFHRHKKDNITITKELKILDIRSYGLSKIIIGN